MRSVPFRPPQSTSPHCPVLALASGPTIPTPGPSQSPEFDAEAANRLSELLDKQRSDTIEEAAGIADETLPDSVLTKLLSLKPASVRGNISTSAPPNTRDEQIGFRKIGFGQCGLIFEKPGTAYAVKLARPFFHDGLWNDFLSHLRVHESFASQETPPDCRIPAVFSYLPKEHTSDAVAEWWDANGRLFETTREFPLPTMALITERILPLPSAARNALIEKFCPYNLKDAVRQNPTNRDCLARVYLGKQKPQGPAPPNFSLRNFNLHLDQMIELGLPVETYAKAMGEALAMIHWDARIDGYDIEFVLGSEAEMQITYADFPEGSIELTVEDLEAGQPHQALDAVTEEKDILERRTARLWVLDFNLCSRFTEQVLLDKAHHGMLVDQLVLSFFENDPYYPLPLMEADVAKNLWSTFSHEYLRKSEEVFLAKYAKASELPSRFIEGCIAREKEKLAAGLGHGHRDFKG